MTPHQILAASSIAVLLGTTSLASAQSLTTADAIDDRVDNIIENVDDEFALSNDPERSSNVQYAPGWRGTAYLSADLTTGNTETFDVSVGSRVTGGFGPWNQTISLAYEYGEASNAESKNELFVLYDITRDFSDRFYVYGLARAENDFFNDTNDLFVGVGPGFRIFNEENLAWRVQAGPGYRVSDAFSGGDIDEAGVSASSRFFYGFSDTLSLTNDTDVLWSDAGTILSNDAGITWKLSGPLSARFGVKTDYNSDPSAGQVDTDTTTGVALIVAF